MKILLSFQEELKIKIHKGVPTKSLPQFHLPRFLPCGSLLEVRLNLFLPYFIAFPLFFLHAFFCLNILFIFFVFAFQALFSKIAFYYSIFFSKSQYFKLKVYKIVTFLSKHDLCNIRWAWFESNERSIDYESIALTTMLQARSLVGTAGFERTIFRLSVGCSNQLSYVPIWWNLWDLNSEPVN